MASIDSGVETGNESNDGSQDAKSDLAVAQISTIAIPRINIPRINMPSINPVLPVSTFNGVNPARMTARFFLPGNPYPLPAGFGENYGIPSPTVYRAHRGLRKHADRHSKECRYWLGPDSLAERKLRVAVSSNNIEAVQSYLFSGVNPNAADSMGRSPLHLASNRGYADIVRLLLENGANPNQRDRLGNTPLHLAACTNNIVVVTLLLKAGTDVCSSDLHGRSPLQLAQSKLKLLQRHMGGDRQDTQDSANKNLETIHEIPVYGNQLVSKRDLLSIENRVNRNQETFDEIPVYDNTFVANQALQIVEMMRLFLQKRGQDTEAELLSAFSSRLTLSETKEQVETQVRDLLDSLSGLSLSTESQSASDTGSTSTNTFSISNNSLALFSNELSSVNNSLWSSPVVPSSSSLSTPGPFQNYHFPQ